MNYKEPTPTAHLDPHASDIQLQSIENLAHGYCLAVHQDTQPWIAEVMIRAIFAEVELRINNPAILDSEAREERYEYLAEYHTGVGQHHIAELLYMVGNCPDMDVHLNHVWRDVLGYIRSIAIDGMAAKGWEPPFLHDDGIMDDAFGKAIEEHADKRSSQR